MTHRHSGFCFIVRLSELVIYILKKHWGFICFLLQSQCLCALILWLVWHFVVKILPFSVMFAVMLVPSSTNGISISWYFLIQLPHQLIVTRNLITTEKTIIFIMFLVYKGCCNFLRIIREIDHQVSEIFFVMFLSFSCAIGSPLPSDILTVKEVNRKFQLPS